mmetsp:Transcript_24675/g.64430  ORF Transcript_24675/g.64430 Transcript_24675/m.64430 type:complete len:451 (-) Transcript_24675:82-1434(-)
MMTSVVVIREATEAASASAVRTTLVGSMMPASIMLTYSPVAALKPKVRVSSFNNVWTTTPLSAPAFCAICMQGCLMAALIASTPTCWSRFSSLRLSSFEDANSSAVPPPGTIPSSSAAFVAFNASFSLSLTSLTSTSLAPPTLMTATPPLSFASLSFILSFSYSDVEASIASRISSQRSDILALSPAPSSRIVSSLPIVTVLAVPSWDSWTSSSLPPVSSLMSSAPVRTAKSFMMALRLSPNPGAFMAATFRPPRSLLTISMASASPSTSSAHSSSGFCSLATCSRRGRIAWTEEIFLSYIRIRGLSISTFWALAFVTKYGEMYPLSSFMPSTTSSSCSMVLPSETVMVPSFPTFSNASQIIPPMLSSPFAAMVATLLMLAGESMAVACAARSSSTALTAASIPRLMSMGFMPAATALHPSRKMALAKTVAVVVPSPATSLVLLATVLTS